MRFSIDKITLTGHKEKKLFEEITNDMISDNIIENRYRANFPYDYTYKLIGGGILQVANTSYDDRGDMRIEFNPNKQNLKQINRLLIALKYPKVTRLDIALDIDEYGDLLSDYELLDQYSRKKRFFTNGSNRIETQYIGATSSDIQVRIYDKTKEREENANQLVKDNWWRVEAQLRGKALSEMTNEKIILPNPFEGLILIRKKYDFENIKPTERIMLKGLLADQTEWNNLSQNTKLKYKKILSNSAKRDSIDLKKIYDENQTDIKYKIKKLLEPTKQNQIILFNKLRTETNINIDTGQITIENDDREKYPDSVLNEHIK